MITASTKYPAETHILNLKTNRYVLRDSKVGQKLIKEYERAQIEAELPPTESKVKPKPQQQPQPAKAVPSNQELIARLGVEAVTQHQDEMRGLSKKQIDEFIRELLIAKLQKPSKSKARGRSAKAKVKTKSKGRVKKFRIATPPLSSASESSDSDSSSESD